MSRKINTTMLQELLRSCNDETEQFVNLQSRLNGNIGTQYLYENVLMPLMKDQTVRSNELDMGQFDRGDLDDLYNFFEDQFGNRSEELSKLHRIFSACSASAPQRTNVGFI